MNELPPHHVEKSPYRHSTPSCEEGSPIEIKVGSIAATLLHGAPLPPLKSDILKTIFIKCDNEFLRSFQKELQRELDFMVNHLPQTTEEELVWNAFRGNLIALLPFCYPENGAEFYIPTKIGEEYKTLLYVTEVLDLPYIPSTTPIKALGLVPKEHSAPPLLSFLGTTFPAASGFASTLMADFTPAHSVGEGVYKKNRNIITTWIDNHPRPQLFGMSLGGAMAFHTLIDHKDKIDEVYVFNPPGLYKSMWKEGVGNTPQVNIYCQTGDLVSELGAWPEGENISLYSVSSDVKHNVLSAHAKVFTGFETVTIQKKDPTVANSSWKRKLVTFLHQWIAPLFVFVPLGFTLLLYLTAKKVTQVVKKYLDIHK